MTGTAFFLQSLCAVSDGLVKSKHSEVQRKLYHERDSCDTGSGVSRVSGEAEENVGTFPADSTVK
jgi:hypothetical protein